MAEIRINEALPTSEKPKTYMGEFNQPVREYDWQDFQNRLKMRMPYTGKEDLNGETMVVRHCWGLGDVLYMTPALKAIKEKFPKMRLITITNFPDILKDNPAVDENCHWLQFEDFMDLADKLKFKKWYFVSYDVPLKGGFDYKIHLRTQPKLNEHLMDLLKKDPKTLSGDDKVFVDCASSTLINRYKMVALDLYCYHLHVDPPVKSVYYYPTESELEFARNFMKPLRAKGYKIVTLMPHTSTMFKDYPHWKEVIRECPKNYYWLILGGKRHDGENWNGLNMFDCGGAFNLRQSAAIVIEADMACSSDTGLTYTRLARGGKAVMTYGPHEPEPFLHYFPSAKGLRVESVSGLREGPCCTVGCYIDTTACRPGGGYPPCLDQLSPKRVADAVQEQMHG